MIYKKQRAGLLVLSTIRPALFVARGVQKRHFQFAPEKDDIARQLYSYCPKILSLGYRKNRVQTVDYNQNEHSAVHGSTQAVAMIKASSYPALMICINLSVPRRLTARLKLYARKESPVSAATLTFPLVSR